MAGNINRPALPIPGYCALDYPVVDGPFAGFKPLVTVKKEFMDKGYLIGKELLV